MAQEATTIARPYAEAVFARASESATHDQWSDTLALLAAIAADPSVGAISDNPNVGKEQVSELLLDICGEHLNDEGKNLTRLLVENDRLRILPEIVALYEARKADVEGIIEVEVTSAYPLDDAQKQTIANVLKEKLNREIEITVTEDPELIGGMRIQAGDLVIDGTVQGQLTKLANELGI